MPEPLISNVPDTARWMAVYRAAESARPDALFDDSYAERFAGDRGRAIAAVAPRLLDQALTGATKALVLTRGAADLPRPTRRRRAIGGIETARSGVVDVRLLPSSPCPPTD